MVNVLAILEQKVATLMKSVKKIKSLAYELTIESNEEAQRIRQALQTEYQKWYRAAKQLMMRHDFTGSSDFEKEYKDINLYIRFCDRYSEYEYNDFLTRFQAQVALLAALPAEIEAQSYVLLKVLSTDMALSELEQAEILLTKNFDRPAGVLARVALEHYVKRLYQSTIGSQPKSSFEQCTIDLKKAGVFEERHRKHITSLYSIGSDCAHAGRPVPKDEITKLIAEVKAVVLHGK